MEKESRIKERTTKIKKRFSFFRKDKGVRYLMQFVVITERYYHGPCGDFWAVIDVSPVKLSEKF